MLVKVFGAAVHGVEATTISIEVNVGGGVPAFALVGLPDNAVRESYERVRSALTVNKYNFPNGRVIVNMAPADIRKEGAAYDLFNHMTAQTRITAYYDLVILRHRCAALCRIGSRETNDIYRIETFAYRSAYCSADAGYRFN